jgi:hypothetical protein
MDSGFDNDDDDDDDNNNNNDNIIIMPLLLTAVLPQNTTIRFEHRIRRKYNKDKNSKLTLNG